MPIDQVSDPAVALPAGEPAETRRESIAARAYELYVARGQRPGNAFEDWLRAESEIGGAAEPGEASAG